jgi:uncharacterized protein
MGTGNGKSESNEIQQSPRTRLKRMPKRASYDREVVNHLLDTAMVCHVGFAIEGQPYVIPTLHVRIGERLYIHGSAASRMLGEAASGTQLCVTVTHIDGLVMARSAFHHSVNYRSVVILGKAELVEGREEKLAVMKGLVEHIAPGRWDHVRPPNEKELVQTSVLGLLIDEVSAKLRSGPPLDADDDYALPIWAGVIPLAVSALAPIPDDRLDASVALPEHLRNYRPPVNRAASG